MNNTKNLRKKTHKPKMGFRKMYNTKNNNTIHKEATTSIGVFSTLSIIGSEACLIS